ncbi:hypothetical protein ATY81_22270 [Rhizobium sp. R72]|uniref:DUF2934 domain-containing protein n=1 Tax=unclassified Rhizobium TaxID=2613769 RepID=UPI000B536BB9|nr:MULTISPECIES: DUF2934 domain-containing protein [unclassified Rhizobium]OWW02371.1 hypothetical protein ATY81_22270 [Rhizobium sp. R72]OWW02505.1 hypothetical protein ATY80_22270 [Rhizobium sp. R711]
MAKPTPPVQGTLPDETAISTPDRTPDPDRTDEVTESIRRRAHQIWESEGRPEGRPDDHWIQAEREILHGRNELGGDDAPNLDALREAAREHTDTYVVKTDLEDADQREATPGVREQP